MTDIPLSGKDKSGKKLFNPQQANRLRIGCQHVDQLLTDIETILNTGSSTAAFPQYRPDVTPVRHQCIEDYIAQIRSRLIQVLKSTNIPIEQPKVSVSKAVSVRLTAISISVDELRPSYMKGYGSLNSESESELNGIVGEMQAVVKQLHQFLNETGGQNITERLSRLQQEDNNLTLLSRIEDVVTRLGLVEFRGIIASILDRAEDKQFEIAVFGRVSSGKSSLLNAILETDILPVGVTPVTALPIHIGQGDEPSITVSFADRDPVKTGTEHLHEYATEQDNPSNKKRVSRIRITLPSPRLKEGIGFVDTPGLGSLATSGAAETRAYLPNADLGIVLIDSGSTLTAEDLGTIMALREAAVPVHVLISKADLLSAPDCTRLIDYVRDQIAARCGEPYPVWPVSVQSSHRYLLTQWYTDHILPFSAMANALKEASVQRKIGLLRESVVSALQSRVEPTAPLTPEMKKNFREVEAAIRQGNGWIEEKRLETMRMSEIALSDLTGLWNILVPAIADQITNANGHETSPDDLIRQTIMHYIQERIIPAYDLIQSLATRLQVITKGSASALAIEVSPDEQQFNSLIRDMPIFDPGDISVTFSLPVYSSLLGRNHIEKTVKYQLVRQLKPFLKSSLTDYSRLFTRWSESMIQTLERSYEDTAAQYRAQITRLQNGTGHDSDEIRNIEEEITKLREPL
jgi:GTP-binding protein EngB required for normal cell division